MDYEKLKEVIAKKIKENGRREITGPVLQAVLMAMVDSLGEVYPQTYTDEEKAQARANIDALSDYDGEITKEKLSLEVQAILNDVANKQNITDASLATIAKTIVGAINEVYKGGLKDASIATSKIEDGAITEPKLDTALTAKVNNNVKTVEQNLTDDEVDTVLKNLKFRDANGNFFADKVSYNSAFKEGAANGSIFGTFCRDNTFGAECYANVCGNNFLYNKIGAGCSSNIFGNDCRANTIGGDCNNNTFGNGCKWNTLKGVCSNNILGNGCEYNDLGVHAINVHLDSGVSYIELKSNASGFGKPLQNIHILSGVRGEDYVRKLVINIPDEYLNSARELIIATKRTDGGPSTPEDIVMYYADEVADKQNKQDTTLATTSKEVVGAINELFNGGVKDTSIVGAKLADATVTSTKIAARTIIGDNIQNKTIRTEQIADNAITTENIKEYAVTSDKIKDGSITGYKIPNEAILERHLGYWSVTKNKIAEGQVSLDKLAFAVQDTLKMVGTNVKEISYKSMGNKIPNIDDIIETGIYILPDAEKYNGSTYSALPVDLRYSNVKLLIVGPTSQSGGDQRQTLIAINYSSLVGICTREARTSTGFVNLPFSYTSIQSAIEGKIDNTSTLTDTEVNNIWDNN